jgi:hypothetical protein
MRRFVELLMQLFRHEALGPHLAGNPRRFRGSAPVAGGADVQTRRGFVRGSFAGS